LSIKSFLLQNYNNKELVIVDGKSTDGSHKIIDKYSAKHKEVIWIKKRDAGISDAINIGISQSSGEIIGYLGSDDILYQNILAKIAFNCQFIDFDAIYFNSINYWPTKKKAILRNCPSCELTKRNLLKYGTIVGLQNIYFKKHIFKKYKFDINNKFSMDFEFLLKISPENYLYYFVDSVATINIQDTNITRLRQKQQDKEALKIAWAYCHNLGDRLILLRRIIKTKLYQYL
jgi:glycosyltransferase involved in cell wall biosynthesis